MRLVLFLFVLLIAASSAFAEKVVLVLGDSLSAGYGIAPTLAWPALLNKRLTDTRKDYSVANLSISGDTTAGGRSRLDKALRSYHPAVLILALGANDGLRGLALAPMRDNLTAMIDAAQRSGARVLLVGMQLPPNYGPYANDFAATFHSVAQAKKVPLLPFLLEPVVSRPTLFQPDNLHPLAEAQPLLLDHVWPALVPLLK